MHDILSPESDADMLYHERVGPELTRQVWNLADEDIDGDFPVIPEQYPSVYVNPAQGLQDSFNCIIRWILLVLCLWSSFCVISDNAMEILLEFLRAVFDSLATVVPGIGSFAALFPKSLHLLKKQLGIDQDKFIKYVVCPKCDTLYNFDDCYELQNRKRVSKKCTFIEFPNHRQHFRRTQCGEPLLREVTLKSGQTRLYPFKVYCYQSVRDTLRRFLQKPGFALKCELWRERDVPHGFLADVFDGRVWKEWQYVNGKAFLAVSRNYAFILNVDWFQPFKHSLYSVGALYMVLMNLPRSERFKLENVILVGIIPGPHEPKLTINSYLQPLVAELNLFWKDGITVRALGALTSEVYHAALLCVECDVPAARKVCGFTGHVSCKGCSKCTKYFPGTVMTKIDFSGFDLPSPPRTNHKHREEAQEILNQTSAGDRASLEQQFGTRFSELMSLPYFDCVRFHIIDPMHNLFTGTAKHVMKNIWLDGENPLIKKNDLINIQEKLDKIKAPSDVGRMPRKILNSYGGFTADQWKTFTTLFSIYASSDILPKPHLELWRQFVLACSFICSPVISETRALLAHSYLLNFCKGFEQLYGNHRVTPNMHLHTHLVDCILDFGPVYSFWLFSFERYNGIVGDYGTNQRSVEIQLMRKFISNQFVKDLPLPSKFHEHFKPIMDRLISRQTGSLQEYSLSKENVDPRNLIMTSMLSIGNVRKDVTWSAADSSYVCCVPHHRDCLGDEFLPHLKKCYTSIFDDVDEESITGHFKRFALCTFSGDKYGSSLSRGDRSSYILARWCALGGKIDTSGSDLRPGIIQFFMEQTIQVNGQPVPCILAFLRWFQSHPSRYSLGAPVEVWCKDLFELEGEATFIPVKRVHGRFVPVFGVIQREHVLVVCPLPRKLHC